MLIQVSDLYNYITPQQAEQFLAINPEAFNQAYSDAVGYLNAQIGNIYNLPIMLANIDDPDPTLLWMVRILTAYNMSSPTMKQSAPMVFNIETVYRKVQELKAGFSSFTTEVERASTPNALGSIISVENQYKG